MEEGWKVKEKSIPQLESISPWHMGGPWLSPHNRPLHHPDRRAAECTSKAITGQKWGEVTQATAFRPLHNSPTTTMSIQKQWNYSSWESDNMLFKKHLWGGKKKRLVRNVLLQKQRSTQRNSGLCYSFHFSLSAKQACGEYTTWGWWEQSTLTEFSCAKAKECLTTQEKPKPASFQTKALIPLPYLTYPAEKQLPMMRTSQKPSHFKYQLVTQIQEPRFDCVVWWPNTEIS